VQHAATLHAPARALDQPTTQLLLPLEDRQFSIFILSLLALLEAQHLKSSTIHKLVGRLPHLQTRSHKSRLAVRPTQCSLCPHGDQVSQHSEMPRWAASGRSAHMPAYVARCWGSPYR